MSTLVARLREFLQRIFFWHERGARSHEFTPEPLHDHALVLSVTTPGAVPRFRQLRYIGRVLNTRERRLFAGALIVFVIAIVTTIWGIVQPHLIPVPASGGKVVEAVIGTAKYPNPLYASTNDPDQDLVSLVYAGLFKRTNGSNILPDIVERFEWSKDAKQLTLTLRTDVRFHDGTPLTSDDVVFTLNAAKDPTWRSTVQGGLRGVAVSALDERTVVVTLDHPDVTILDTLTIGILPEHIWQDIPPGSAPLADANIRPIGAGPWRIRSFRRDGRGLILAYTLERNDRYHGIKPFLDQIELRYFPDQLQAEEALRGGQVDSLGFIPGPNLSALTKTERIAAATIELPQETIAFFNTTDPILKDERVRRALSLVIERQEIVNAQANIATPVNGPFPFLPVTTPTSTAEERLESARALLTNAGWIIPASGGDVRVKASASSTLLAFTVHVPNTPDLLAVADVLKRRWSLLGANITIHTDEPDAIIRHAMADRKDQILLWNVLLSPSQDVYPIWWSGETRGRGLNLSNLADRSVDDLIKSVRAATSTDALLEERIKLQNAILATSPAIFLTRPGYGYVYNRRIHGVSDRLQLGRPSDRLNDVINWYVKRGWRWK
jgi:peptide/nickel transport system substrate-binding protein